MAWKFWQKAPKPIEVTGFDREPLDIHFPEPAMPAREQAEDPAPAGVVCVITRWKQFGVVYEHHSVCGLGLEYVSSKAPVTVQTWHRV